MKDLSSHFDALLFDLDGTLVDSIPDLTTSVNLLREELDLCEINEEQVRSYVGDGVGLLVQRALPPELFSPEQRARFVEIYTEHLTDQTFIYPGILPFLEIHRDRPMAVVTNKPQNLAEILLDRLKLTPYFEQVIGAENGLQKKPHPDMINRAVQNLAVDPQRAIMFGDHHVDLRAAQTAGVVNCFCGWGLGHDGGLTPDYRIETTVELMELFPGNGR
ncbi:MAG: HAD family hydrolase [Desulfuromonas sp.]|nr:MAG: HAD family hydrolase [Desulfuromonas sp.]